MSNTTMIDAGLIAKAETAIDRISDQLAAYRLGMAMFARDNSDHESRRLALEAKARLEVLLDDSTALTARPA